MAAVHRGSGPPVLRWSRRIGSFRLDSWQSARDGCLIERAGPGAVHFLVRVENGALRCQQISMRLFGVLLPASLAPQIAAYVTSEGDGWRVAVAVDWRGRLIWRYGAVMRVSTRLATWDFIEEDRTRRLPGGEGAMHAVVGIVYGAFLSRLVPEMMQWSATPSGFGVAYHGFPAWLLLVLALGVLASGIRDVLATTRSARWPGLPLA